MLDTDTLVFPGSEVKSLGDGKFGGYLILFGSPEKADLVGDYFTPATDFGPNTKSRVYYDHGTDPTLKRLPIGEVEFKIDAKGVWADGVLKARADYSDIVKEIIGKDLPELIAGKKMGLSSGTAAHLVERKGGVKAGEITAWPLGLDASLTATPCEPRTLAMPLKSWVPSFAKGVHLGQRAEVGAAMQAVAHLHDRLHMKTWDQMGDEKSAPKARMKAIGDAYDECKSLCMKCMKSLMVTADHADGADAANGPADGAEADDAGKKALLRMHDNFLMMSDRLRGLDLD